MKSKPKPKWHNKRPDFAIYATSKMSHKLRPDAPVVELRGVTGGEQAWFASLNGPYVPYVGPCKDKREAMRVARSLYPEHPLFAYIENAP